MLEISLTYQDPPQQHARSTAATSYSNMPDISLTHQNPPQQHDILIFYRYQSHTKIHHSNTPRSTTATRYTNMLDISITLQDPPQQHARSTTATSRSTTATSYSNMPDISLTHQDPPQQHARSTTATRYTNMPDISLTHQDPPHQHDILRGTGMIASSSTFRPHLGRVIRDLFRLLDAVTALYGSTSLQQSSKGSCSLLVSGYNLRVYCQWRTLVPPLNSGANAAPASVLVLM